ncbi:hypothetical protein R1sor_013704 [Riccia sorocarpa]|uniref:Uncharacterized protein n=1 Tax=Riccia sorocarpa TaxID=122646 RepID=A0ABD3HAZ2_9MARC
MTPENAGRRNLFFIPVRLRYGIVLDSDDESEEADFHPSGSSFGSQRVLELALQIDQEAMLSPSKCSVSNKIKHFRNRVLVVEGPGLAARLDTKSPPAGKKSTSVVPLQGNYAKLTTALDERTTAGPVFDFDTAKQDAKTIRKRKSRGEAGKEVGPEQDNKENNGAKALAGNGVKMPAEAHRRCEFRFASLRMGAVGLSLTDYTGTAGKELVPKNTAPSACATGIEKYLLRCKRKTIGSAHGVDGYAAAACACEYTSASFVWYISPLGAAS